MSNSTQTNNSKSNEIAELAEYADDGELFDMQSTLTQSCFQQPQSGSRKHDNADEDDEGEVIDVYESTNEQLKSLYEGHETIKSDTKSDQESSVKEEKNLSDSTSTSTFQAKEPTPAMSQPNQLGASASQIQVRSDEIKTLLQVFVVNQFRSREPDASAIQIQQICASLFACDPQNESLLVIGNQNGELSSTYPPQLLVPTNAKVPIDRKRLHQLINTAKFARCRCRFPVPVILFNQKYICRSATLSGGAEIYGRQGMDLLLGSTEEEDPSSSRNSPNVDSSIQAVKTSASISPIESLPEEIECLDEAIDEAQAVASEQQVSSGLFGNISSFVASTASFTTSAGTETNDKSSNNEQITARSTSVTSSNAIAPATTTASYLTSHFPSLSAFTRSDSSQVVNAVRTQDIALLDYLRVHQIVDLMVEKKKVKFGVNITSSEKADKLHRYRQFEILCLPYPGCEFFKQYRNNQYQAEGLVYDWQQAFVDAVLEIPDKKFISSRLLPVDFSAYKQWDVITLTQNYLRLIMFNLIADNQQSMLVHCISGWDRTPLYISLLRLSLWADRRVHVTLSAEQITYLTLAYDWYLFGHNLADRVSKGEEILFFCFYFLKFISSPDYAVDHFIRQTYAASKTNPKGKCCEACKPSTNANHQESRPLKSEPVADPGPIHHTKPKCNEPTTFTTDESYGTIADRLSSVVLSQSTAKSTSSSPPQSLQSSLLSSTRTLTNERCTYTAELPVTNPNSTTTSAAANVPVGTPTDLNELQLYDIISLDDQSLSSNSSIETMPSRLSKKTIGRTDSRKSSSNFSFVPQSNASNEDRMCKFTLDYDDEDDSPQLSRKQQDGDLEDLLPIYHSSNEDFDSLGRNSSDTNLIRRSNAMAIPNSNSNRRSTNQVSFGTNQGNQTSFDSTNAARLTLNQSNSSLNRSDSWQLVTETGSIRDKGFYSSPESFKSNGSTLLFANAANATNRNRNSFIRSNNLNISNANSNTSKNASSAATSSAPFSNDFKFNLNDRLISLCCCNEPTCARLCPVVKEQQQANGSLDPSVDRELRLQQVRSLFYSCYSSVIGYPRHRNGPDLGTSRTFQALFSQLDTIGINPFSRISTPNL